VDTQGELTMKTNMTLCAALIAVLMLTGCNQAKSPEKVQSDVAHADASADKDTGKAEDRQARVDASENNKESVATDRAENAKADAAADTMVTEAQGVNKVALAKCEALSGDAQSACKDQANAALEMAKANAKGMKAAHN
jgi:hypothetical protein